MKAVLVIEMPKDCSECPLSLETEGEVCANLCRAFESYHFNSHSTEKPDWCPFREPPKKRNEDVFPLSPLLEMTYSEYSKGWNDCIDAIAEPDKG